MRTSSDRDDAVLRRNLATGKLTKALLLTLGVFLPGVVFGSGTALGHAGHEHTDARNASPVSAGRIPGQPDVAKAGRTTYRYIPAIREYKIETPGRSPAYMHADLAMGEDDPEDPLTFATLPKLKPACRAATDAFHTRVVWVYAYDPSNSTEPTRPRPEATQEISDMVERMNWTIRHESSLSSEGKRELQLVSECDASGSPLVRIVATEAESASGLLLSVLQELAKELPVEYGPGLPYKYVIFNDTGHGTCSCAQGPSDDEKSPWNDSNVGIAGAIVKWGSRNSKTPLHELFHTLSAVQNTAPFSTGHFHCTDGFDMMCYNDGGPKAEEYSVTRCPLEQKQAENRVWLIDCGYDSYFNAEAGPGEWLYSHFNIGEDSDFLIDPPEATTGTAAGIGGEKATVEGLVDPNGDELTAAQEGQTTYYFEYGTTTGYGTLAPVPRKALAAGSGPVGVSQALTGLEPQTTYHYRLVASEKDVEDYGADMTFTTANSGKPAVTTQRVSQANETTATLRGSVNTRSLATTYRFEYGQTAAYGSSTAVGNLAAGSNAVEVTASLSSLMPGATYHYRVSATNSEGTNVGGDREFKTCPVGGCKWSFQSPPSTEAGTDNSLTDVSCASQSMCMAAGTDAATSQGLLQLWNGSNWSILQAGSVGTSLSDISCASTTFCMAIGKDSQGPGIWQVVDWGEWMTAGVSPLVPSGGANLKLEDVSCSSASSEYPGFSPCTVVGSYTTEAGGTLPLVERWDGSKWSLQSAQLPSQREGKLTILHSVSCVSSSSCVAVGANKPNTAEENLAEHWNGTSWSIASAPKPAGASHSELRAVSCDSASACMATGRSKESASGAWSPFAERWSSSSWSTLAMQVPSGADETNLGNISCSSPTSCVAVGGHTSWSSWPFVQKPLLGTWDGEKWSIQFSPTPEGDSWSTLLGVACTSATACTAVGRTRPGLESGAQVPLALRWE